ncbi:MAG: ATP-binding cassette domain-containing protein, partial [Nitratireductor sp.]|nr:ATP-binding cassette domain-containing protein [Nitratireductor sp.]
MDNSDALGTAGKHSVSLRGITKRYGSIVVNDTIDLDVVEGEFLTLLGASGSGKTTLLRIVAGLDRCDSGTVCIEGRDVTNLPARQRNLGMVFQQYSLFPHMTISENISYGLKLRGWSRRETRERVAEMLDMVRLPGVEDRLPRQLSGGQQQRVALARALAAKPEVMMLDEPLGALDLKLRKQLQIELKRIHQQTGTTFLFVTHDQEEALSMSDRIAVLRDGRIEQLA